jgi:hypothetical protein
MMVKQYFHSSTAQTSPHLSVSIAVWVGIWVKGRFALKRTLPRNMKADPDWGSLIWVSFLKY